MDVPLASIALGEFDFCSLRHRTNFHTVLKKGLELIVRDYSRVPKSSGPFIRFEPYAPGRLPSSIPLIPIPYRIAVQDRLPIAVEAFERNEPIIQTAEPAPKPADAPAPRDRVADLGARLGALRAALKRVQIIQHRLPQPLPNAEGQL
jgi:hypothetical protein